MIYSPILALAAARRMVDDILLPDHTRAIAAMLLRQNQDKITLRATLEGLLPMMRTQSEESPTWGKAVLLVEKILRETP